MRALFQLMATQHGVATTAQARRLGVSRRVQQRLLTDGTLWAPCPDVLGVGGVPLTFERRAMAAALSRGVLAISHGAAARLHGLDGFGEYADVDVLAVRGAHLHDQLGATVHRTRGAVHEYLTTVEGIPVLSIAATLTLLAPTVGAHQMATALESAIRRGVEVDELRDVAAAWRRRGRAGPPVLTHLLTVRELRERLAQPGDVSPAAS